MTEEQRKYRVEAQMTKVVGQPVKLTVRGARSFTFSTESVSGDLGDKVAEFFGALAKVIVVHDEDCGSFAFVEVV